MNNSTDNKLAELKDDVLHYLFLDAEIKANKPISQQEKDSAIKVLFLTRTEEAVEEKLLNAQNKWLLNLNESQKIDINELAFKNNVAACSNVLNCNADMIVVVTDCLLEDMIKLYLESVDNNLILKAGLEFKADLIKTLKANAQKIDYENPYIMPAYNLCSKYICKIIYNKKYFNLINFNNKNIKNDKNYIVFLNILKNNLLNLFNFVKNNKINSLAFYFNFAAPLSQNIDGVSLSEKGNKNRNLKKLKEDLFNYAKKLFKKLKIKLIFNL